MRSRSVRPLSASRRAGLPEVADPAQRFLEYVFLALLYLPLTETSVLIYALLLGLLWLGTIPLTSGLIVTFFGPRWLSMLYGIVFLSHQVGSFMGAWIGGWLYDTTRSYDLLWWAAVVVAVLAALLHLPIREQSAPRPAVAAAPAE